MKKLITSIIALILLAHSAVAQQKQTSDIDQSKLLGIWSAHKFKSDAGGTTPRIEFKKDGTFSMISQFGIKKGGTWKWIKPNNAELHYPTVQKKILLKIISITETHLITEIRGRTEYVRVRKKTKRGTQQ